MYTLYGQYHSQTKKLTPSEENFLDTFLKVLYKINPTLHNNFDKDEKNRYIYLAIRMGNIL